MERSILLFLMKVFPRLLTRGWSEGQRKLHPDYRVYLALRKILGKKGMGEQPPVKSRRTYRQDSVVHRLDVHVDTQEFTVDMRDGHKGKARFYLVAEASPLVLYFHGGGYVIGDLDMYDHVCSFMAQTTGFNVLAIDYRKAPEAPFPMAIHDGIDAYEWALKNTEALRIADKKIIVAGDSAGGNLAAIVAQEMVRTKAIVPSMQLLIYPTCDWSRSYPSEEKFGQNYFLTSEDFHYFAKHYHANQDIDKKMPWVSPLFGTLEGLPPTLLVTAGFDPLRDQGEAYVSALRSAGVAVTHIDEKAAIHGFINMIGFSTYSRMIFRETLLHFKSAWKTIEMTYPQ